MTAEWARLADLPGRDGFAGLFIPDVAAAASVSLGHQAAGGGPGSRPAGGASRPFRRASDASGAGSARQGRRAAALTMFRRVVTVPRLLPRTVQLCVHCRRNPAGFWVSGRRDQTVRRPWCLSCCQGLDQGRCDVIRFDD